MRTFVIPKQIRFPGGYVVEVKQLPHREFLKESDSLPEHRASTNLGDTIYLDTSRTVAQRRADFIHEFIHNVLDWQSTAFDLPGVDPKG